MPPKKKVDVRSDYDKQLENQRMHASHWDNIPPLNYPYKIGDRVHLGGLQDCRIEDFESPDGRLLLLTYEDKGKPYGLPFDNNRRMPIVVAWTDIVPARDQQPESFAERAKHCKRPSFSNTILSSLTGRLYRNGVIDSPDYQRGYVWTEQDKVRLIESIFDHQDIGKFVYAYDSTYRDPRTEIIDGKQRLRTLMDFMENKWAFKGKLWTDLSHYDRHHIREYGIQTAELCKPRWTRLDILATFLSINAAAVPQTEAHIAHVKALYAAELEKQK